MWKFLLRLKNFTSYNSFLSLSSWNVLLLNDDTVKRNNYSSRFSVLRRQDRWESRSRSFCLLFILLIHILWHRNNFLIPNLKLWNTCSFYLSAFNFDYIDCSSRNLITEWYFSIINLHCIEQTEQKGTRRKKNQKITKMH